MRSKLLWLRTRDRAKGIHLECPPAADGELGKLLCLVHAVRVALAIRIEDDLVRFAPIALALPRWQTKVGPLRVQIVAARHDLVLFRPLVARVLAPIVIHSVLTILNYFAQIGRAHV